MKHARLFTLLLGSIFSLTVANAQIFKTRPQGTVQGSEFTKEAMKAFKEAKAINLQIDMANATIMNLDSADFVAWYSASPATLTLKRFKNCVVKAVKENTKKTVCCPASADVPYLLKLDIESISENAGIDAKLYLYDTTEGGRKELLHEDIRIKDGRMNSFENLLQENAELLGLQVAKVM